jgi:hypothetical protein
LHERFFPGAATDELSQRVTDIGIDARRDTVRAIREALEFVRNGRIDDEIGVQRFAIAQALALNGTDRERRRPTEELWQHLHLRGRMLMRQRGVVPADHVRSGWGVAAGS